MWKSVKRNVNLILFVHLFLYFHTKLSTKLRNSCYRGLVQSVCKSEFSLFYGSLHSSQATAMFLAFLQDFIAHECIEGDRLISTSVTCKLECLTLPCVPEHHLRNNNNSFCLCCFLLIQLHSYRL